MLTPLAAGVTVTIHRRQVTGVGAYGRDAVTWTDEDVGGCGWWPGSAGRNVAAARQSGDAEFRTTSIVRAQVALPAATTPPDVDDELTVDGHRWQISGEPSQTVSQITGSQGAVIVSVERSDG